MKRAMRAAAVVMLAAGAALAGATANAEPRQSLDWQPCAENPNVECATLTVPIDWARPATGTIDMAVARKRATDQENRIGTLLFLPGGPGGSGVNGVLGGLPTPPRVTARFDLVSFDPRGTNRSHPVICDPTLVAGEPNLVPDTGGTLAAVVAHNKKLAASCRKHTGPLLDHVDARSIARDVDALRAALGEDTVSLFGLSYGSLTGQIYAELFPDRVRALVLDSVLDHSIGPRRFLESAADAAEDAFTEFANWCAADERCALHGRDVPALVDELYDRALAGDLHQPGDPAKPLPPLEFVQLIAAPLDGPLWTDLANLLVALESQDSMRVTAEPVAFPRALFCADHRVPVSSQREWVSLWRLQNRVAPHLRSTLYWSWMSGCIGWPARVGNPQHPVDIDADVPPILMLNAAHDASTGYRWATNVAGQIDNGVLLTYAGWGHGVVFRSECTAGAVDGYLVDGTLPSPGTHCPAVQP